MRLLATVRIYENLQVVTDKKRSFGEVVDNFTQN